MTSTDTRKWVPAVLLLAALGCSSPERAPADDPDTLRARDSAIGASELPGAAGVRGAIQAADSAAARRAREDSVTEP